MLGHWASTLSKPARVVMKSGMALWMTLDRSDSPSRIIPGTAGLANAIWTEISVFEGRLEFKNTQALTKQCLLTLAWLTHTSFPVIVQRFLRSARQQQNRRLT